MLPLSRFKVPDLLDAMSDLIKVQARAIKPDAAHLLASHPNASLRNLAEEIGRRSLLAQGGDLNREKAYLPNWCVRAALSTPDFGAILGDTVRVLVNQALTPNLAHRALAQLIELNDFRPAATGATQPDEVAERDESGEFRVTTLECTEGGNIQLKYWGRIIDITPEVLVNDDVQLIVTAVEKIAASISRVEARELVGGLAENPNLPDGQPVFHSDFENEVTHADVFGTGGVGAGVAALRLQKAKADNEALNLPPRFLLCHPNNEISARTTLFACQLHEQVEVFPHSRIGATEAIWLTGPDQMAVLGLGFMKGSDGKAMVEPAKRFASGGVGQRITHMFATSVLGRVGAVRVRPA